MNTRISKWILSIVGAALLVVAAAPAQAKKLSLAELAALEWKLEQGSKTLTTNPDVAARKKALDDLASIKDPRTAKPLALALKEDPDASVRLKAAEALAELKSPEAKGLLTMTSTSDPAANVRARATELLKKFPRRMTVAALPTKGRRFRSPRGKLTGKLLRKILTSPSGDARLWAVRKIGRVKFKGRAPLLETHLFNDPSARVRAEAARWLRKIRRKRALPTLIKAVGDGNPLVRFEVARLIAEFDDSGALKVLQSVAQNDTNKDVKAEARELLEPKTKAGKRLLAMRIKKLRSPNPGDRVTAINELAGFTHWRAMLPMACALLSDKSAPVRTTAAKVLTDMHDSSILTALRVSAVTEPDKKIKRLVRKQVGALRRKVDNLIKQLTRSKDPAERALAARFIGQAAYPPGLKPLIKATKDKSPKVRLAVAEALQNYTTTAAIDALKVIGTDKDARVRKEVDTYFKKQRRLHKYRSFFKDSNRVVMKTSDKDPKWRADASIALGISGAETAVGTLAQLLLHDKNVTVRLAAAWSLVLMASERGELALKKAGEKDKSEKVRLTARKFLVIDKVSLEDLIKQLRDESAQVRQDAAEALSLRPKKVTLNPMIRAAMCDAEPAVRSAAMRGLARIGNPMARTAIKVAMTRDPSKRVRRVAYMMYILAGGK